MSSCECGCGEETRIGRKTERRYDHEKGKPRRFLPGHNFRNNDARLSDREINADGYVQVSARLHGDGYEHRAIAARALGRPLPEGVEVHHLDEDTTHNARGNLVICQDRAYHKLLHLRQRALAECGNPSWRKCYHCQCYDAPERLQIFANTVRHKECYTVYARNLRRAKRMEMSNGR